ncbi:MULTISPECIES: porin [Rhodophyticola]|jgi:outer membrane protein OmpU|uniref:porin n=1 Tax=Rhodophyticola TaxID=2680018 RepID=UPI0035CE9C06
MKKVLFATTALVALAGAAAADVTISGSAEMGIIGGDRDAAGDPVNGALATTDATQFFNDVDIRFTLSGTTDNGLTFGAVVDLDEAGNLGNEIDNQGTSVFLSGNFGTLTLGDTDGALDWALSEANTAGNPGSIDDAETVHAGYLGSYGDGQGGGVNGDNQVLRYEYTFDSFGIAISHEQNAPAATGLVPTNARDGSTAIGFRYDAALAGVDLQFGLGYQVTDFGTADDQAIVGVSVAAVFAGGFEATIQYSDWTDVNGAAGVDDDHIGIGLGYSFDAFSIHANYGEFDSGAEGFGLAAAYDLGGGAGIHLGYGSSDQGGFSTDFWSLGVAMSF